MTTPQQSVTIVGAGITGPAAALNLAREGYRVVVLEQRPESELHSNGLVGITPRNWDALTRAGVDFRKRELRRRMFREVGVGRERSPFHLIAWTDLHDAITQAAREAGAQFAFGTPRIDPAHVMGDYVFDAGGIVSAARRLRSDYLGSFIYRGISPVNVRDPFTTYKLSGKRGFMDVAYTHAGCAWAFGLRRPRPTHFATTFTTDPPPETAELPARFRKIIMATPEIMVLPQSHWHVATSVHDGSWRRFTIGDANGPVRPLTTSGANLGVRAGMMTHELMAGSEAMARDLLQRRAYAIELGLKLRGPEIGGWIEDPDFAANQAALYGNLPS